MTALLTDNLPLLAGAPNGIKKLRELILELAVRGKLVPQDPNDEPASELLKRIAVEKEALSSKVKKPSEASDCAGAFELPESWCWASFGDIAQHNSGKTLDKARNSGVPRDYITTSNLYWGRFELSGVRQMLIEEKDLARCTAIMNDLLICEGGEAGRAAVWDQEREICFQNHVHRARFFGGINPYYAQRCFERLNYSGEIAEYRKGVGISNMSSKSLASIPVPLPPVAEQHRIVAKVDELMTLCDRLEAQQADAESAHAQLVQALLDSLTQASDAADFAANWQRLAEHFHTLFTTESSIDALKQTLLQLAVMGKLVPQDPSDEPAANLLQRNDITSQPHTLQGWAKIPLGHLGEILGGSTPSKANAEFWNGDIPWVSPKDMKRPVIHDSEDHISAKALAETSLKAVPPKSLLMVVRGMILVHSFPVALTAREVTINQDMKALVPPEEISDYLLMYLQATKAVIVGLVDRSSHGTCKLISEKLWSHIVCLPPLPEQHRIVAKVDQLMALCDQLKARLSQARQLNEQLASTLVERALAEDGQHARVTTDQKAARALLAAEITHQLHGQRTFGQRKLQKVIYLAEHAARLAAVKGNYLRDAAGPHDRQLMNQVESELCNRQWYECIDRETFGHAYRPLSQAGQHRQAYDSAWSTAERATIERVIDLMRDWDTDRCEMTVTLYAAWNDFILEGRPVIDEAIVDEVMHSWNDAKLRFSKDEWLAVLADMKKHELLTPTGFGQRTTGGMLSLPGFE
ncbi:restriction endonuclease subunit S [Pseudomonas chengduensis]|nr:restriction endonuclease subunit S [Pseudomonas chengduensis]MDH1558218.1 restriction endonuclease subunit S [Pseudomonas chengduensis]HBO1819738.1 restriction endonuclease subunit S [Pseudomonas aeruginosa]